MRVAGVTGGVLSSPRGTWGHESLLFSLAPCTDACSHGRNDISICTISEDARDQAAFLNTDRMMALLLTNSGVSQLVSAHAPAAIPDTSGLHAMPRLCDRHSSPGESKGVRIVVFQPSTAAHDMQPPLHSAEGYQIGSGPLAWTQFPCST